MADGDKILIPEYLSDDGGGKLGRHVFHDPRNRMFAARGNLFLESDPIVPRVWWLRHLFDQGGESRCTAETAAGMVFSSPNRLELDRMNLDRYDEPHERQELYLVAQRDHDPWEGAEPEYYGTSSDAPARELRRRGHIREWRWNFGLMDVLRTLSWWGPVGTGIYWYDRMDRPEGDEAILNIGGSIRGGHEVLLYAVRPDEDYDGGGYVDGINSWGEWGPRRGRFRMTWATLGELLEQQGDAWTIVL